jgi:hypothetical protein
MSEHYISVTMRTLTCKRCSTTFCVQAGVLKNRERLGQQVSCPNGHHHELYLNTDEVWIRLPARTKKVRSVKIA